MAATLSNMTASSWIINGYEYSRCSIPKAQIKFKTPNSPLPSFHRFRTELGPNCKPFTSISLKTSYKKNKTLELCFRVPMISCLMEGSSEAYSEEEQISVPSSSQQEASIDLKLPRRSLLATFTCNACSARSERLINRLAYERGLVYIQCSGCSKYHKLVDNLGLVVEYNLQEQIDLDTTTDNV